VVTDENAKRRWSPPADNVVSPFAGEKTSSTSTVPLVGLNRSAALAWVEHVQKAMAVIDESVTVVEGAGFPTAPPNPNELIPYTPVGMLRTPTALLKAMNMWASLDEQPTSTISLFPGSEEAEKLVLAREFPRPALPVPSTVMVQVPSE
jgi:hypothetical protein